jgi:hypothetical protein
MIIIKIYSFSKKNLIATATAVAVFIPWIYELYGYKYIEGYSGLLYCRILYKGNCTVLNGN